MKRFIAGIAALLIAVSITPAKAVIPNADGGIKLSKIYGIPVIANRDNTLSSNYVPKLMTVPGTYYRLEEETLRAYQRLHAAAWDAGHKNLKLQSAYRSYETQKSLYNNKVNSLRAAYGDNAPDIAAMSIARPGQSEHQLGNTIDIADYGKLYQTFGATEAGIWLAENAHLFGFILRYPENKTDITGVMYEPWHFRYVGERLAAYIYEHELTLEEYLALALGE